jgi:hypothetical protein
VRRKIWTGVLPGIILVVAGVGAWGGLKQRQERSLAPRFERGGIAAHAAHFQKADHSSPGGLEVDSVLEAYVNQPLRFEENRGQLGERANEVAYFARAKGYDLFVTQRDIALHFPVEQGGERGDGVLRFSFVGARRAELRGEGLFAGKSHYLSGADPELWRRDVPSFQSVRASSVYPGIDVIYYGGGVGQQSLEFDFVVAPGADPALIRMGVAGARSLAIDADGGVRVDLGGRSIRFSPPEAFQAEEEVPVGGRGVEQTPPVRRKVLCRFQQLGQDEVGLVVGPYDRSRPLVIDPVVQFATFLGGGRKEVILDLAIDAFGSAYVTGWTTSLDYPLLQFGGGDRQSVDSTGVIFVSKLAAGGAGLAYSTYIGNGGGRGTSIAVDLLGAAYVTGNTRDERFPTTAGAFQTRPQGPAEWPFVFKLDHHGAALVYSTFLTGTEGATAAGVAVDRFGSAYVTGQARAGFPTTPWAVQPQYHGGFGDCFVAQLDPLGRQLVYGTYLGGADLDQGRAITVDTAGNAYLTGTTARALVFSMSTAGDLSIGEERPAETFQTPGQGSLAGFPVTPGAVQESLRGRSDLFVAAIRPGGGALLYSTLLGGSGQETGFAEEPFVGRTIAVDDAGQVYVTGTTTSSDFPTTPGAYRRTLQGEADVLLAKLQADGTRLLYSTLLGGRDREGGRALAIDPEGNVSLTGWTTSPDFPVTWDRLPQSPTPSLLHPAAFVVKVDTTGSRLLSSTLLGGGGSDQGTAIAVDRLGSVYVGGTTTSANFPIQPPAIQVDLRGGQDGFIVKLQSGGGGLQVSSIFPAVGGDGGTVTVLLQGAQIRDGASVRLVRQGEPAIEGRFVHPGQEGRSIGAVFDLRGRSRGSWNVLVINPNGDTAVLRDGFRIEPAREATILVDQPWGPHAIRNGQRQIYTVGYRHTGNNDLYGVPIWIKVRSAASLRVVTPLARPGAIPGEPTVDWPESLTSMGTVDGGATTAFLPALIPPGRTGYVSVEVTGLLTVGGIMTLEAWAYPPSTEPPWDRSGVVECYLTVAKLVAQQAGTLVHERCNERAAEAWRALLSGAVQETLRQPDQAVQVLSLSQVMQAVAMAAMRCAGTVPTINQVSNAANRVLGVRDEMRNCFSRKISSVFRLLATVRTLDLNDLRGTIGFGPQQYLPGGRPLHYAVYFENPATAAQGVREVVISDQLDPMTLDFETFQFGAISFGTQVFVPPPGVDHLVREFDLRPTRNLMVRMVADFDRRTGLATWRFFSFDPSTGQPVSDPRDGFLPPNLASPQGGGSVLFAIHPRADLVSGSVIQNQAVIQLDRQSPILTQPWSNRIDLLKPVSRIEAVPVVQQETRFTLRWSGNDDDSGIAHYTIYLSVDRGPFLPWLSETTTTSATYTGLLGHHYAFYSVAQDRVGNVEEPPPIPHTTTILQRFDVGIQDDRTGDFLLFNSLNGDYFVTQCGASGFSASGRGLVSRRSYTIFLNAPLVTAQVEQPPFGVSSYFGEARVRRSSASVPFLILDRTQSNNTWRCFE